MTPPFGYNLFLMRAMAPKEITLQDIYRSILPFVLIMVIGLAIVMAFPEIATYEFFPENGTAEVSFRCRMRTSSFIMIIAEMNDGTIGVNKKYVDVMLGACS